MTDFPKDRDELATERNKIMSEQHEAKAILKEFDERESGIKSE